MDYNKIVSVSGLSGLFELLSSKSDGAVVRSLEDNTTKFVSTRQHNFSHLESIEVFTVKEKKQQGLHVPDNKLMREFIKRHFPKATFTVVKGDAEMEISNYLRNHPENELVELGAYQRSELSRWFKMSMADVLMKELNMPLFIAHNK